MPKRRKKHLASPRPKKTPKGPKISKTKKHPDPKKAHESKDFSSATSKAREYAKNPAMAFGVANEALQKAEKVKGQCSLSKVLEPLLTIIRLVTAWAKGEYTVVPWKTIVLALSAIVYFLVPTDLIPDFILGLGYIDDAAVIAWVVKSIKTDLDAFMQWEIDTT